MFRFFYDFALLIFFVFSLPKWLWQWKVLGKYRESLAARLGLTLPTLDTRGKQVIWIHAISMGETRAIIPLFHQIKKRYPQALLVLSSTTETGHAEAKRSMPSADAHFFLPLDFSWIIRRLVKQIQPTTLILCESDFWYNLLDICYKNGTKVCLVNGKISERSLHRFQKIPFFTKKLFAPFSLLCLQNETYAERFLSLNIPKEKLFVTGNLKFDSSVTPLSPSEKQHLRQTLKIEEGDRVLCIGSTHAPEEEWILSALIPVWRKIPALKVLLVPRHPERFQAVADQIKRQGIAFSRYSENPTESTPLVLIDTMGLLNKCYELAELAIVGGSFVSHVGGHNILEPILLNVPVLFGPHMHSQPELSELILNAHAGLQLEIEALAETLIQLLENPQEYQNLQENCRALATSLPGATHRTLEKIDKFIAI